MPLLFVEEMIQSYKARNYSRAHNYTFLLTLPHLISSLTDWSRFKVEWMNKSQYRNEFYFIRFHTPAHLQMGVFRTEWFALLMRCRYIVAVSHLIRVNNVSPINSLISLYLVCCVMINNSRMEVLKDCLVLHQNRSSQCTSVINMLWSDSREHMIFWTSLQPVLTSVSGDPIMSVQVQISAGHTHFNPTAFLISQTVKFGVCNSKVRGSIPRQCQNWSNVYQMCTASHFG